MKLFGGGRLRAPSSAAGRDIVGIDFSGSDLKLVHIRASYGKIEIANLSSRSISGLSDADLSRAILSSFQSFGAKNPRVVSVITSNSAITKNIEIPSIDPKEIREIINLQAGRHTPYSRDEIVIDYLDVGVHKNIYTKILLIIVACNVIKRQFDIVGKAGVKLNRVLFAPEGIGRSASSILGTDTSALPVSVVNIDGSFTDFAVVYNNNLIFERSIPIGSQQLSEDRERNAARFAEELKRSLETYQGENIDRAPGVLILSGAVEEMAGVEKLLNDALHVPIRTVPYLKSVTVKPEALAASNSAKKTSFFNILASIMALDDLRISLVPEEVKISRSIEDRGKELIKTGIFVFAAFILVCMILVSHIYFKTSYLNMLKTKYSNIDTEARALESGFDTVSTVRNYLSGRGYSLEVLTELHDLVPKNIQLNDIRYDDAGKISVKGTAEAMSSVFSFVELMEKSRYFKDVKTKYTTKRKEGAKDLTDFEINAVLEKAAG